MWAAIASLSFLAFIVLIILGIMSKIKKKVNSKRIFMYSIACFILFVVAGIISNPTPKTEPVASKTKVDSPVDKVPTAKAEQETDKEEQQAVLDFEKDFYAVEKASSPVFEEYKKAMLGLSDGSSDMLTAYSAAEQAKKESNSMMYSFQKIKTPKSVSKEIRKLLDGAKSDIKMAYSFKEDAYKSILNYIDDQKVSDMSKSQEYMEQSDQYVLSGLSKIIEAKSKAGIDISTEKK